MTSQNQSRGGDADRQSTAQHGRQQTELRGQQDKGQTTSDQASRGDGGPQRKLDSYDEEGLAMSRMTGHKSEQAPSPAEAQHVDERSDDRITNDIKEELTRHGEMDSSDVVVQVHDGEVTLAGTVNSEESKRQVEEIVKGVASARQVTNQIRVRRKDQFPDSGVPTS